jgi:hypothetical protein
MMELTVAPPRRRLRGPKLLTDRTRMIRLMELEHHVRCWVNAYVQELEGKRGGSNYIPYSELRARQWRNIRDIMLGILTQEGHIAPEDTEEDDREN